MSAWTELPNGRWQLRVQDDHWYQADPSGEVILSPMGIKRAVVSGGLEAAKREALRLYRLSLEAQQTRGERLTMTARVGLAMLDKEPA